MLPLIYAGWLAAGVVAGYGACKYVNKDKKYTQSDIDECSKASKNSYTKGVKDAARVFKKCPVYPLVLKHMGELKFNETLVFDTNVLFDNEVMKLVKQYSKNLRTRFLKVVDFDNTENVDQKLNKFVLANVKSTFSDNDENTPLNSKEFIISKLK